MGQAIVYCAGCQCRLTGADFEKGAAFEVGATSYCAACAKNALPALPKPVREFLEEKINGPRGAPAPAGPAKPKEVPSRRVPARPGSTAKIPQVPEQRSRRSLMIGMAGGAAVLLVLGIWALSGGKDEPPKQNPGDSGPTPRPADPAVQAKKRKDALDRERAAIEENLRTCLDRDDFKNAFAALATAAGRLPEAAWKAFVEERLRATREKARERGRALKDAAVARKSGEELAALKEKVADWGSPELLEEIDAAIAALPEPGLVGYWKFDEGSGTTARDASGNGNGGTLQKESGWVRADDRKALAFNGTDDFVEVAAGPSLDLTGEVTIAAWVKLAATGVDQKILGRQDGGHGGYKLGIFTDNKVEFEIRDADKGIALNREVAGGTALTAGTWIHVAGVYSPSGHFLRTYVNGAPDRELSTPMILASTTGSLKIGREPFWSGCFLNGALGGVRVYSRALTDAEIQSLYQKGK